MTVENNVMAPGMESIVLAKWRVENNSKDRNFVWEKTVCPGKTVLLGEKEMFAFAVRRSKGLGPYLGNRMVLGISLYVQHR